MNSSSRWWEFYFIRYFVGSVFGACVIYGLLVARDSPLHSVGSGMDIKGEISFEYLVMLLLLGVGYCYIASAPIFVLHAVRGLYVNEKSKNNYIWLNVLIALISILILILIWMGCWSGARSYQLMSMTLTSFVLVGQLIFVFLSLSEGGLRKTVDYGKAVAKARANKKKVTAEYLESYRHLREHANAFLVIFFEVVLGMFIFSIPKSEIYMVFVALFFWTFPAGLIWLLATHLESRLPDVPRFVN